MGSAESVPASHADALTVRRPHRRPHVPAAHFNTWAFFKHNKKSPFAQDAQLDAGPGLRPNFKCFFRLLDARLNASHSLFRISTSTLGS